jgi:hypothetical protein
MQARCFHCLERKLQTNTACSTCGRVPKLDVELQLAQYLSSREWTVAEALELKKAISGEAARVPKEAVPIIQRMQSEKRSRITQRNAEIARIEKDRRRELGIAPKEPERPPSPLMRFIAGAAFLQLLYLQLQSN